MAVIKRVKHGKHKESSGGQKRSNEWDSVCAFCDDGGDLLCCDGGCLRSFHPTKEHGKASMCRTLKLTEERWQTLKRGKHKENTRKYICKNCRRKKHQCFVCGLLGSSDLSSSPKVFQCKEEKCGHFYHPKCVAKLLYPGSKTKAFRFMQHIADGLEFHCPIHVCSSCKEAENIHDKKLQFALCRRCPTVYHRKCLPSDISFEANEKDGNPQRAWDNIFTNRVLIYCMKHEIKRELATPLRDHIVFPDARDLSAKVPKDAPSEQEDKLEYPLSRPCDQSHESSAETGHDRPRPVDSFAPKYLFPHPQPGSCGWLDE